MSSRTSALFGRFRLRLVLLSSTMIVAGAPIAAHAQASRDSVQLAQAQPGQFRFDVPPQELDSALTNVANQGGIRIFFTSAELNGLRTGGVSDTMTVEQALSQILMGTGFGWRYREAGTVVIERLPQVSSGAIQLGPVQVEGAAGGTPANGQSWSRDPSATEGTGSYTTRAITLGKAHVSLRETPQSVSIVTRARIEDQGFVDVADALRYVTGITLPTASSVYTNYVPTARGYAGSLQIDGVSQRLDTVSTAALDLAVYDRIEILRGPAGLFNGAGSAGVTTNLVRKRALGETQARGVLSPGSWGSYRGEGDITGSLSQSGAVRARLIAVAEKRGDWHDNTSNDKQLVYGTVELDLGPGTTLSGGAAWQHADSNFSKGLPTFTNGQLIDVPRSTSFAADWTGNKLDNSDLFVELEHAIKGGGSFRAIVRRTTASTTYKDLSPGDFVLLNGDLDLFSQSNRFGNENLTADAYVSLPFELMGQTHNIVFGGDYSRYHNTLTFRESPMYPVATVNVLAPFDASDIPEPPFPADPFLDQDTKIASYGVYGQIRIKPVSILTLVGGARVSWQDTDIFNRLTDTTTSGAQASGKLTPYAAAIVDVAKSLSLYASYAEIFQPQTQMTFEGAILPPRIGSQFELGIKGEWLDGRLNASAALYRIIDTNNSLADPAHRGFFLAQGKRRAQGLEAEISGEITSGWNVTAGYAYTETKFIKGTAAQTGLPFSTITPKHNFNLWTHYRLPEGLVPGLELGAGVRSVSSFFSTGFGVRVVGKPYTIVSALVGYNIDENLKVMINLENLFDKTYYDGAGGGFSNYYGPPRSFMVSLRAKY